FGAGFRKHLLDLANYPLGTCGVNTLVISQSATGYVEQFYIGNFAPSPVGSWTASFAIPFSQQFAGITVDSESFGSPALSTAVIPVSSSAETLVITASTFLGESWFDLVDISM